MPDTDRPEKMGPPGLRERKKAETRRRVADIAAQMFIERGYENVRMVDIAQAADISAQTLYNYFPTKEDLIFDQDREFEEFILRAVTERPSDQGLVESVRANALQFLEQISPAIGKPSWVPASVATGPELRRVWLEINARCADSLTDALIAAEKGRLARPAAKVMARSIVALFAVIVEGAGEGTVAGKPRRAIIREIRAAVEASAEIMRRGFSAFRGVDPRRDSQARRTSHQASEPSGQ
jgi:AcrR family transcriptional regulator